MNITLLALTCIIEYCETEMAKQPKYLKAYQLYLSLIDIDKDAVKKLRAIVSVVGSSYIANNLSKKLHNFHNTIIRLKLMSGRRLKEAIFSFLIR